MYAIHKRLVAYILLISHSLMSCHNHDMLAGQKQMTEEVQEQEQPKIFLTTQEQANHQPIQVSISEHPAVLSTATIDQQEGLIADVPAKLTQATTPSPLSKNTQQEPRSSSASAIAHPATLKISYGGKNDKVAIEKSQLTQQVNFFYPLHPIFRNRQSCQIQFTSPDL